MKNVMLSEKSDTAVETTKMMSDMMRTGLRPYRSLADPHITDPIPMPIMAMDIPIWVMDGVVWNSFIIEGIVGRYMSLTSEENAPIMAMNTTNRP